MPVHFFVFLVTVISWKVYLECDNLQCLFFTAHCNFICFLFCFLFLSFSLKTEASGLMVQSSFHLHWQLPLTSDNSSLIMKVTKPLHAPKWFFFNCWENEGTVPDYFEIDKGHEIKNKIKRGRKEPPWNDISDMSLIFRYSGISVIFHLTVVSIYLP